MPNKIQPSPQNLAILDAWEHSDDHLMVNALAGTGKTTQLTMLGDLMMKLPKKSTLALAFNKKNALDLAAKMPSYFECSTLNSIGHRALGRTFNSKLRVDERKIGNIIKEQAESFGYGKLSTDEFLDILSVVNWARVQGLVPDHYRAKGWKAILPDDTESWENICLDRTVDYTPDLTQLARTILRESIAQGYKGVIDYDDQIYMSALGPAAYQKYSVVMVDEAPDLSALNHIQIRKSLAPNGRFVIVGDTHQAIYAFRGASTESMQQITKLSTKPFQQLPLSITYRCPRAIVERQKAHVPEYEAAPTNSEGQIVDLRHSGGWSMDDIPSGRLGIVCCNNAPVLGMAFRLTASGYGVTMLGRDIGKNLSRLLTKITKGPETSVEDAIKAIDEWCKSEVSKARANDREALVSGVEDRTACLLAVANSEASKIETVEDMQKALVDLFEDQSGLITLSTGHRAKGMEWPTVIHLDPWRIPSKFAKRQAEDGDHRQMQQELNLRYVIETRAMETLVLANKEDFMP